MKKATDISLDPKIVKEIELNHIPYSNRVDFKTFSRILDDDKVTTSYKMY